jgi:hypothetical protein
VKYMLLIYAAETGWGDTPRDEIDAHMAEWFAYTDELEKSGKLISGDALQPTATATTVRGANRQTTVVDGPFAETKEALGGYYLIDVEDLDEAIEWSRKMPVFAFEGAVEVRPLMEFNPPS